MIGNIGDEAAVKHAMRRIAEAWDANDANAFADLHTDDATMVYPGSLTRGKERIRTYMAGGFAAGLMGTKSKEDLLSLRFVAEDVAIVNTVGGFAFPGEEEVREEQSRHATRVLRRLDGDWRVESVHYSYS